MLTPRNPKPPTTTNQLYFKTMENWKTGIMETIKSNGSLFRFFSPPHLSTLPPFHSSARPTRAGFTLVEILVVIAIISLLAGVVLLNIAPQLGMGKQAAAQAQIQVLSSALTTYHLAHGFYPIPQQGLEALVRKPVREPIPENYPDGGYLNSRTIPLDPWKRPYIYLSPGLQNEPFEILSYGADGEPGGTGANADISSAHAD
ncbi:MAG: type II secretion system major pseudopilin GspG [Kiritimatiellia bacterium]|nr:type II secretion system major pseudopilin GspG [Kiritimatiellia bacterium]